MTRGARSSEPATVNGPRVTNSRRSGAVAQAVPAAVTVLAAGWTWLMVADVVDFPASPGVRDALSTLLPVALGLTGMAFVHVRRRSVWSPTASWIVAGFAIVLGAAPLSGWINLPMWL